MLCTESNAELDLMALRSRPEMRSTVHAQPTVPPRCPEAVFLKIHKMVAHRGLGQVI